MRLIESHNSREFTVDGVTWRGMAWHSDDSAEVYGQVRLDTPAFLYGFVRKDIVAKPVGGGVWEIEVPYGTGEFPAIDAGNGAGGTPGSGGAPSAPGRAVPAPAHGDSQLEGSFQFTIEVPRFKITQSLATISRTKRNGGAARDYKGAIAPDKDGKVQGAEVPPNPSSSFSRTVPGLVLTMNFYRILIGCAGCTNRAKWYEFEPGELLYMGCDGSFKQSEGWTITHKFGVELNRVNIDICAGLVVPAKKGFEYLWVDYEEIEDGGGIVTVPRAAYVEKVFNTADFTLLGMG